ncbi:hypothetical protein VNI00_015388 [Paramarasmius palmivorus]|uniref:Aminotransferase-like plant mobile domain-containing protein n=1 Tax=Paramarasmius palmivorus TaxID=297713 RepID=A0AAW0BKN5_9AGAR
MSLSNLRDFQTMWLDYRLLATKECASFSASWVSQAPSIFSQLGIKGDEWDKYSILHGFWLVFERELECQPPSSRGSALPGDTPVYFFVKQVPLGHSKALWDLWAKETKYFWSLDETGKKGLVDTQLNLPSFTFSIEIDHVWWDRVAYETVRNLHVVEGVDSFAPDITRTLDLPVLEVIRDRATFKIKEVDAYLSFVTFSYFHRFSYEEKLRRISSSESFA